MTTNQEIFLYNIDIDLDVPKPINLDSASATLNQWVTDLITIIDKSDSREFRFISKTSEVHSLAQTIIEDDSLDKESKEKLCLQIAYRLLNTEKHAQEKHSHITDIIKGSLIISNIIAPTRNIFILAKVDHEDYIDEDDLEKHGGLPFKKQIYKTCSIVYDDDFNIINIFVSDTNAKISAYWSHDFLEAREINTDEKNTFSAFDAIDRLLKLKIRKKSLTDYVILHNSLIQHFRSNTKYNHTDMIESIFKEYDPILDDLDITKLASDLESLPEKLKEKKLSFDTEFTIVPTEIKSKIKTTYRITDKIQIRLLEDIDNLKETILSEQNNGQYYVRILTDKSGYETFKR